ncbi:hypothetical protein [Fodinicola feengrottensis]
MAGRRRRRTVVSAVLSVSLLALGVVSLGVPPAAADPAVPSPTPTARSGQTWTDGPCVGGSGVTVVADLTPFDGGAVVRRCDPGQPSSAFQALAEVGLAPARGTGKKGNGTYEYLCRITDLPAADGCTGYQSGPGWALSVPDANSTEWKHVGQAVDKYRPPAGALLGFSYGTNPNLPSVSPRDAMTTTPPVSTGPGGSASPTPSTSPSPAAGPATIPPSAVRAATFLADDLYRSGDKYGDPGLVADVVLALHAAGVAPAEAKAATAGLRATAFPAGPPSAGLIAKYLLVALDQGVDAHRWDADRDGRSVDLVRRLLSTVDGNGRFASSTAQNDLSGMQAQALAIVALHRSGATSDEVPAVAYLLRQQCPSGGFRSAPGPGQPAGTCAGPDNADVSVTNTAMAVWALVTAGHQGAALERALRWLAAKRDRSGGYGSDSRTAASIATSVNAGSTGLASLALAAAGNSKEPAGCTGWLGRLQLPVTSTQAELRGAIAPSPADLAALVTTPVAYWTSGDNADRVRQATAQAILGLTATAVALPAAQRAYGAYGAHAGVGQPKAAVGPRTGADNSLPMTGPPAVPLLAIGVLLLLFGVACVVTPVPGPSNELLGWLQRWTRSRVNTY